MQTVVDSFGGLGVQILKDMDSCCMYYNVYIIYHEGVR